MFCSFWISFPLTNFCLLLMSKKSSEECLIIHLFSHAALVRSIKFFNSSGAELLWWFAFIWFRAIYQRYDFKWKWYCQSCHTGFKKTSFLDCLQSQQITKTTGQKYTPYDTRENVWDFWHEKTTPSILISRPANMRVT